MYEGEELKTESNQGNLWQEYKLYLKRKREKILLAQHKDELIPINRRHSKEELEQVKSTLKPVYTSFPRLKRNFIPKFNYPRFGTLDSNDTEHQSFLSSIFITSYYFIGLGILSFPYIYASTGYLSLIQLFLVGITMAYTSSLLHRIQYVCCLESYPDIVELACGYTGRVVLSYIYYFQLLFDCTFYLTVFLNSMLQLAPNPHLREPVEAASVLLFVFVTETVAIKPKILAIFSILGSFSALLFSITLIIAFYGDLKYKSEKEVNQENLRTNQKYHFVVWKCIDLISCFSLTVSLFMVHTAAPNIFRSMQTPAKFPAVINITFSFAILWYVFFTLLAFETYAYEVEENVINSVGLNPYSHWMLSATIHSSLVVMVLARFAITSFPLLQNIEDVFFMFFRNSFHANVGAHNFDSNSMKKSDSRDIHEDLASRFSIIKHNRLLMSDAISPTDYISNPNPVYNAIIGIAKALLPLLCYYLVQQFQGRILLVLKIIGFFGALLCICFPILFSIIIFWKQSYIFEKILAFILIGLVFILAFSSLYLELHQTSSTQSVPQMTFNVNNISSSHQNCLRH